MAVCLEREPTFILNLEVTDIHHSGYVAICSEILVGTIEECYFVGKRHHWRLKPSEGGLNHKYNIEGAIKRNRDRLTEWLDDPIFQHIALFFGYQPAPIARTLRLVMNGQTDIVEPYLSKMKHKKQEIVQNGKKTKRPR